MKKNVLWGHFQDGTRAEIIAINPVNAGAGVESYATIISFNGRLETCRASMFTKVERGPREKTAAPVEKKTVAEFRDALFYLIDREDSRPPIAHAELTDSGEDYLEVEFGEFIGGSKASTLARCRFRITIKEITGDKC